MTAIRRSLVALALISSAVPAPAQTSIAPVDERPGRPVPAHLYALTTDDFVSGDLLDVRGDPPARVRTLAATGGGQRMRRFGDDLYLVHVPAGTVERISLVGAGSETFDLGPGSAPQDVHVVVGTRGRVAWITRRPDPFLHRIDLETGTGVDAVDLGPLGQGALIALGTMERDGTHLFVQLKVQGLAPDRDRGLLAVVDLATETLVDVDSQQPGVQGVQLQGAPPRLPMQIVETTRTLFVSATEGVLDGRGAIEMVDLDALASIGPAVSERQVADLGGFVMTTADAGYLVFHTDFAASTHLLRFTLQGGPVFEGGLLDLLGDSIDTLAYDARRHRLYLPSRFADGAIGIHVFDTLTNTQVGRGPILTGSRVHDVLVAR